MVARLRSWFVLSILAVAALGFFPASSYAVDPPVDPPPLIIPYVQCVVPESPQPDTWTIVWGYYSLEDDIKRIPAGRPQDWFDPGPSTLPNMPQTFLPGFNFGAFKMSNDIGVTSMTWNILDESATAYSPYGSNSSPICGPTYGGEYSTSAHYVPQEIVFQGGSSWIAKTPNQGQAPSLTSAFWQPLALAGAQGPTGPAGPQGTTGAEGHEGHAGPEGDTGPRGPQGTPGTSGAAGPRGDTGPAGAPGDAGPLGPTGPAGEGGTAGPKGETGARGVSGTTGETGPEGPPGAIGPTGPVGAPGTDGTDGQDGAPGKNGTPGTVMIGGRAKFNAHGRATVKNNGISSKSLITIQYADPRLRKPKPTNVTAIRDGTFVVTGSPRARFIYMGSRTG